MRKDHLIEALGISWKIKKLEKLPRRVILLGTVPYAYNVSKSEFTQHDIAAVGTLYMYWQNILICLSSCRDESEVAKLLIEAGADVNGKNHKGTSAIIIAAVKGNQSVLRILASNPNIRLNDQVTPYVAILIDNVTIIPTGLGW